MRINFLAGILIVCCGVLFFSKSAFCVEADKIAAIVNGDVITENEVSTFMKLTDMAKESGMTADDPKVLRRQLLERMIEDRLILQEAKTLGLKPDDKMIEDRIKEIRTRAGSDMAFEIALKEQGVSLSELKEKFRNQLLIYLAVQKEVKSKVQISPKEVTDYYEAHRDQFTAPETVIVDSIFVKDKEALATVEADLDKGMRFDQAMEKHSKKSTLGAVGRGQLKKDMEDMIFSLKAGIPSKPVAVEDGFYIFLFKEKLEPTIRSLDEVKDEISAKLEEEKTERRLREWLESLKDKAYISIRQI